MMYERFHRFLLNFRALPGRRRGGGGLGDTFTTTNAASFGLGGVFGGKPRSAGIKIGGGSSTDPMLGKYFLLLQNKYCNG